MQFWIISGVNFVSILGALLDPGFQSKPKGNKGFLLFPGFKWGTFCGTFGDHFWYPMVCPFGGQATSCDLSFPRFHFFTTITFSIQFRPLPAGLKKYRPDWLGFWCFHFFRPNFFNTTTPGPAGGLENENHLKNAVSFPSENEDLVQQLITGIISFGDIGNSLRVLETGKAFRFISK